MVDIVTSFIVVITHSTATSRLTKRESEYPEMQVPVFIAMLFPACSWEEECAKFNKS